MKQSQTQDEFLSILQKERAPIAVYLTNGIKLVGRIEIFDAYAVLLKSDVSQLIYKHAIATVVPLAAVKGVEEEPHYAGTTINRSNSPVITRKRSRIVT